MDQVEGEGDAKRAFDSPHRMVVEMCMRRFGIPEWYVERTSARQAAAPREDASRVKRMLTVRSSRVQGRGEEELKRFHEYEKERKRKRLKVLEEQQLRERSEERPLKVARTEAESRVRGEEYQRQRGEVRFDRG